MKRLTFLLALSALVVGCTSRIPAGFQPLSSGKGGNGFGGETLDTRPTGYDAMANAIRNGTIPPEAILATVYFDFDRYNVSASERGKLDAIAARVKGTTRCLAKKGKRSSARNAASRCDVLQNSRSVLVGKAAKKPCVSLSKLCQPKAPAPKMAARPTSTIFLNFMTGSSWLVQVANLALASRFRLMPCSAANSARLR